jgi:hypothetical protein
VVTAPLVALPEAAAEAAELDCSEEAAVGPAAMELSASGPGSTAKASGKPTVEVGSPQPLRGSK